MASGVHRAVMLATLLLAAAGPPPGAEPAPRSLPGRLPVLGFGLNVHHVGDLPLYLRSVDAVAELGANTLLVTTPMFQHRADSVEIRCDPDRCPTDEQLLAILGRARQRGLQTMLVPIVLIESPGEDDWRGTIRPADLDAWWASYDRFLDRYVDIAVRAQVDVLSVGSELNSREGEASRWRRIIDRVRARYAGRVTYTANWDRYAGVEWWAMTDFISVSAYFDLVPEDPQAGVETLTRAWDARRGRLVDFARRSGRPLLLMEVGYPSLPWAAAHPWNYVPRDGAAADHEAQARCWRAFFESWTGAVTQPGGPVLGFNCYSWDPYHRGGSTDTGYGVLGKPAFDVIREGFATIRGETSGAP